MESKGLSNFREKIWVAVRSTDPQFKVGDMIIPKKGDKPSQFFFNIDTDEVYYVKWEFLCYRDELADPVRKKEIIEKVEKIKGQVPEASKHLTKAVEE